MCMEHMNFIKALVAWDLRHISTVRHGILLDPMISDKRFLHKIQTING